MSDPLSAWVLVVVSTPSPSPTVDGSVGTNAEGLQLSAPEATLIAAVTAAVIALATSAFVGRREQRKYAIELTVKRLNELYAPIKLLLAQDAVLAHQLKSTKPSGWHLLDNVESVRTADGELPIAKQIVGINKKVATILESKSGLCDGPIPDSFSAFLGHHYMVERAVAGKPFVKNADFEYFPKSFEDSIEVGYKALRENLDKEMKPWYRRWLRRTPA